jgi:hypothetical protein
VEHRTGYTVWETLMYGRVGAVVVELSLSNGLGLGDELALNSGKKISLPTAALEALAAVQVECLDGDGCPAPVTLAEAWAGRGAPGAAGAAVGQGSRPARHGRVAAAFAPVARD